MNKKYFITFLLKVRHRTIRKILRNKESASRCVSVQIQTDNASLNIFICKYLNKIIVFLYQKACAQGFSDRIFVIFPIQFDKKTMYQKCRLPKLHEY